jgi:cytidine deaminase
MPTPLTQAAIEVRSVAYAPYSGYRVGAALEDSEGRVFTGVNVENVSYGASVCAERTAILKMVSEGGRQIRRMAIATKDGGTPCGICLQTILEFSENPAQVEILTVNERLEQCTYRLSELMPHGFASLEVPRTE